MSGVPILNPGPAPPLIPAKAGVYLSFGFLDSRLRGNERVARRAPVKMYRPVL